MKITVFLALLAYLGVDLYPLVAQDAATLNPWMTFIIQGGSLAVLAYKIIVVDPSTAKATAEESTKQAQALQAVADRISSRYEEILDKLAERYEQRDRINHEEAEKTRAAIVEHGDRCDRRWNNQTD